MESVPSVKVFVDLSDVSHSAKCEGKRIDYAAVMAECRKLGTVVSATVYGTNHTDKMVGFEVFLSKLGFKTKFKNPTLKNQFINSFDWKAGIGMDIAQCSESDIVVLFATSRAYVAIAERRPVYLINVGAHRDLKTNVAKILEVGNIYEAATAAE